MQSNEFFITPFNINTIVEALEQRADSVNISPDLNISHTVLNLDDNSVALAGTIFSVEELKKLAEKLTGIILVKNGKTEKLEFFAGKFYKLRPVCESAPTVEIDGIRMHRTKDVDPWEDSRRKADYAVKTGDAVLDTCSGLGYTAIRAVEKGANSVVTCEKDPNILRIRVMNPHSAGLSDERISVLKGDVFDTIKSFADEQFDSVIHDPPRFSLAGELYGELFYRQLNRVLKRKGRLFHYIGDPYSKGRGRKFVKGILKRLEDAAFKPAHKPQDLGVFALKTSNLI